MSKFPMISKIVGLGNSAAATLSGCGLCSLVSPAILWQIKAVHQFLFSSSFFFFPRVCLVTISFG